MSYGGSGRKPFEFASKIQHVGIIKDPTVQSLLQKCKLPPSTGECVILDSDLVKIVGNEHEKIKTFVAVDGGYSTVSVRKDFPSSEIAFMQFGALVFSSADLLGLAKKEFIEPKDIGKLKNIERFKFALPLKNISLEGRTLINSVRKALSDFFLLNPDENTFSETLAWLLFEEWTGKSVNWVLSGCPLCEASGITFSRSLLSKTYSMPCPKCKGELFLTDAFRFHEVIDNEIGAAGVLGYFTNLFEQVVVLHLIRLFLKTKPSVLSEVLFVKDGPLAFFGQTANLHKPVRKLVGWLYEKHSLYWVGIEKSGAFVEHSAAIKNLIPNGSFLPLSDEYIYKYILPGGISGDSYGSTSYFGKKVIYKTHNGDILVVTLPIETLNLDDFMKKADRWKVSLSCLDILRCNMYENGVVPIALANKLVSISAHPSSVILEKFAIKTMS